MTSKFSGGQSSFLRLGRITTVSYEFSTHHETDFSGNISFNDYPEILRQHGIGGTVRMDVVIAASGNVKEVKLRGGDAALGEAAVAAVKKWKYAPANSETQTEVSISFEPQR